MNDQARDLERLRYIGESIGLIQQYTRGGMESFLKDPMIQDAVLRRLETLTDAAHRLPESMKQRHPQIPWREVRGFRNIAAHAYEGIDLTRVWEIVREHLEPLKKVVEAEIARSLDDRGGSA